MICRLLIVSMVVLPFQPLQAGMLGTDQAISAASVQAERAALQTLLGRSDIAGQLQAMGLDRKVARDRVAAMTDEEVHSLAGKIDSLPAGARGSGWGWAVVIVVAILVWYNWK